MEPLAVGARVTKINSKPDDTHRDGALARVADVLGPDTLGGFGYFVKWDDIPEVPVFIAGSRLKLVSAADSAAGQ